MAAKKAALQVAWSNTSSLTSQVIRLLPIKVDKCRMRMVEKVRCLVEIPKLPYGELSRSSTSSPPLT